jgi:hypothetical protein
MKEDYMEFVFSGFNQQNTIRKYSFQRVASDRSRTWFTVTADLALLKKYSIAVQELPLLCRRLLEAQSEDEQARAFTFTEQDMLTFVGKRTAEREQASQRRVHRRPPSPRAGQAWKASPIPGKLH